MYSLEERQELEARLAMFEKKKEELEKRKRESASMTIDASSTVPFKAKDNTFVQEVLRDAKAAREKHTSVAFEMNEILDELIDSLVPDASPFIQVMIAKAKVSRDKVFQEILGLPPESLPKYLKGHDPGTVCPKCGNTEHTTTVAEGSGDEIDVWGCGTIFYSATGRFVIGVQCQKNMLTAAELRLEELKKSAMYKLDMNGNVMATTVDGTQLDRAPISATAEMVANDRKRKHREMMQTYCCECLAPVKEITDISRGVFIEWQCGSRGDEFGNMTSQSEQCKQMSKMGRV